MTPKMWGCIKNRACFKRWLRFNHFKIDKIHHRRYILLYQCILQILMNTIIKGTFSPVQIDLRVVTLKTIAFSFIYTKFKVYTE